MPTDDDTEDRRFKYPYVASARCSCDLQAIRDVALGESREKMAELFALLQQPPPINPVFAGYFGKVLMALQKADADAFQAYFAAAWAAAAAPEEAARRRRARRARRARRPLPRRRRPPPPPPAVAAGFALPKLMPSSAAAQGRTRCCRL